MNVDWSTGAVGKVIPIFPKSFLTSFRAPNLEIVKKGQLLDFGTSRDPLNGLPQSGTIPGWSATGLEL